MSSTPGNGFITFALLVALIATTIHGGFAMPSHYLDLTRPDHAYMFGFIQADGHLYKNPKQPNKGKLQIEVSARDKDVLDKIQGVLTRLGLKSSITCRSRITNFSKGELAHTFTLTACDMAFRQELERMGVPCGKKSKLVNLPTVPFSEVDYFRGVIDGDGSIGVTAKKVPYLSLVTASDQMASSYTDFARSIMGYTIAANRNKRDSVYNLMLVMEKAVEVLKVLYYEGCLALDRKKYLAAGAISWIRPDSMPKDAFKRRKWTEAEDAIVLSHSISEAAERLGRTKKSVQLHRWRITDGKDRCIR